jgi:NADH-quinone oxidoreductase subunit C
MEFAAICTLLSTKLGDGVLELHEEGVEPWVDMKPDQIAAAAHLLRELPELDFNQLMCLSGIDWDGLDEKGKGKSVAILGYSADGKPETSDRVGEGDLGVAYHLYSHQHGHKFTLRVRVPRGAAMLPSVAEIWPTGAWHEREAWDLVGIRFTGHPDLRRILLDDSWVGHPLRKDYQMPGRWDLAPLEGKPYSVNPHQKPMEPPPAGDADGSGGEG